MALGLGLGLGLETATSQVATSASADGQATAAVDAEFSLGAAAETAPDRAATVTRGDDGSPRVVVEFAGGAACDVGENPPLRATTAHLICGETAALVSVVEDRTCHYVFTVTAPALCDHEAFRVPNDARPVLCEPSRAA